MHCDEAIPHIAVADYFPHQSLKNQHAVRYVPIHTYLFERSFLDFVRSRTTAKSQPLFHSALPHKVKTTRGRSPNALLGTLQTRLVMEAKLCPTDYRQRHTFIDELKQLDKQGQAIYEQRKPLCSNSIKIFLH